MTHCGQIFEMPWEWQQRADCSFSLCKLQLLTEVHLPLLELVVEEAFEAAIDVAGQENLDVRLHEMRYAMPPLKVVIQTQRDALIMGTCCTCCTCSAVIRLVSWPRHVGSLIHCSSVEHM